MSPLVALRRSFLIVWLALPASATLAGSQDTPPAGGAPPSKDAFRMGSPAALPDGVSEEQMWPAATAEGWSRPCLLTWQRSFDDAVRTSKATGKPILVAVNMDGEIASEHFAGVRYRDPETAKLLEPYVCIVASVYRHTPRDYDEQGRRVVCPRFGTVTCGEHIAAETELYAKYFDGQRVSPRHIALELDGSELYDVYYSWDTATVITSFRKGVENRPPASEPVRDGVSLPERTRSADIIDRLAVEEAYAKGDRATRLALLQATVVQREIDQIELLRMAIFGFDLELARVARQALAQGQTEGAVDLIAEALKVPLDPLERDALVAAAVRLGEKFPRARTLAAVHQGLAMGSKWIEPTLGVVSANGAVVAASVERHSEAADANPADAAARLAFAQALLARAEAASLDRRDAKLLLEDARRAAQQAEQLGARGPVLDLTLAVVADRLGDSSTAIARAVAAVEGGLWRSEPAAASATESSQVRVLALFAHARQLGIRKAYRENSSWPPEWLADINAAYAALATHPLVGDEHLVSYYDFLRWLGATSRANGVLDGALQRFPDSRLLHDRLRARLLWESGPAGLESAYSELLARPDATSAATWYAGYAELVAAEHYRRRGELDLALAAYDRGIALYERSIELEPAGRDTCDHFVALACAGRSRVALERGALDLATRDLLAALERRPAAAATPDGLNITPIQTAKMLQAQLAQASNAELAAQVQAALDRLDPALLAPPPSEQQFRAPRGRGDRSGGR